MSHERLTQPVHLNPRDLLGLTEQEQLDRRVSHERFREILNQDQTIIHTVEESSYGLGEFLHVTASRRPADQRRICLTFYGLGFHDYHGRWFTDEWFWYQAHLSPSTIEQTLPKEEVEAAIQQRLHSISPYVEMDALTENGRLQLQEQYVS